MEDDKRPKTIKVNQKIIVPRIANERTLLDVELDKKYVFTDNELTKEIYESLYYKYDLYFYN